MVPMERTRKDIDVWLLQSSKNLKDNSLLMILLKPKPIPFSIASSSGFKVKSNFDFNHNNLVV